MIAVQEFARSMGRGVLVTGGRNSFTLGKYEGYAPGRPAAADNGTTSPGRASAGGFTV
jgi:hypothetical protein